MRRVLVMMMVISSCAQKAPEKPAVVATPEKPAAGAVEKKQDSVEILSFDRSGVHADEVVGQIIGGARWNDRAGENLLVVSQKISNTSDGKLQQIHGYLYRTTGGNRSLLWKIEDRADNWCDEGSGLVSEVIVKDIDGDGIAENAFVYNIAGACDVSPIAYKLMLHSGATKYAIRGENRIDAGDTTLGGTKNFDPAFATAPAGFKEFASRLWDRTVK